MRVGANLFALLLLAASCDRVISDTEDEELAKFDADPNFDVVTCGSTIKLQHSATGYRLHSHDIKLGSGSQQQSVTAVSQNDDQNSLWLIKGRDSSTVCPRGTPVKHGQAIRLMHLKTQKHLHAYQQHSSPLSRQREVAAPADGSAWELVLLDGPKAGGVWLRGKDVLLKHLDSGGYLLAREDWDYNENNCGHQCPIAGHLEVSSTADADRYRHTVQWRTAEGIFWPQGRRAGTEVRIDDPLSAPPAGAAANDPEMKEIDSFMRGTEWYWNNWRNVQFTSDGKFMAPTDDCQRGECSWTVGSGGEILIEWGDAGKHSVRVAADRQSISGFRVKDREACQGTFVKNI